MNTGCEFFEDDVAEHAAGRLTGERARVVVEHLDTCADCRALLGTIHAVRRTVVPVPEDLESRIRSAVHEATNAAVRPGREAPFGKGVASVPRPARPARASTRTRWLLPLAAAAALALVWVGIGDYREGAPASDGGTPEPVVAVEEYAPYGAWPASDMVAGDPLLSELTTEDLERLLEEMES